jgi:hypothetical protein
LRTQRSDKPYEAGTYVISHASRGSLIVIQPDPSNLSRGPMQWVGRLLFWIPFSLFAFVRLLGTNASAGIFRGAGPGGPVLLLAYFFPILPVLMVIGFFLSLAQKRTVRDSEMMTILGVASLLVLLGVSAKYGG